MIFQTHRFSGSLRWFLGFPKATARVSWPWRRSAAPCRRAPNVGSSSRITAPWIWWIWGVHGVDSHVFFSKVLFVFRLLFFDFTFLILWFCCRFLIGKMIFSCLIPNLFQGTCNSLTYNFFPKILSWKRMQKQDAIDEGPNVGNFYNKFPHGKGCIPTGIPHVKDMGISIWDTTAVQRR